MALCNVWPSIPNLVRKYVFTSIATCFYLHTIICVKFPVHHGHYSKLGYVLPWTKSWNFALCLTGEWYVTSCDMNPVLRMVCNEKYPTYSVNKDHQHQLLSLYICCHVAMFILVAWCWTVVAPVLMHWSCLSFVLDHQCEHTNWSVHLLTWSYWYGLAWNCGSSSADTLQLLQSCAGPSVWVHKLLYTYVAMFMSMAWHRTVVTAVLMHWSCCSLALGHPYEHKSWSTCLLPCSF